MLCPYRIIFSGLMPYLDSTDADGEKKGPKGMQINITERVQEKHAAGSLVEVAGFFAYTPAEPNGAFCLFETHQQFKIKSHSSSEFKLIH